MGDGNILDTRIRLGPQICVHVKQVLPGHLVALEKTWKHLIEVGCKNLILQSKKICEALHILVKENSRASDLLIDDEQINEIITLERTSTNTGSHDGLSGFFNLAKKLREKKIESNQVHFRNDKYSIFKNFGKGTK